MIIVFKPKTSEEDVKKVSSQIEAKGLTTHIVVVEDVTICGIIGDTTIVDPKQIEVSPVVERVMHVSEPYKLANRAFHPDDSIIDVSGVKVAGKTGTAQLDLKEGTNNAWFVGFAPADDPQIAISVVIPNVKDYGSQAAAPIAGELLKYAINNLQLEEE